MSEEQKVTKAELKWRKFAEEYTANGFLAVPAARHAGYTDAEIHAGVANQLLRRPEVLRYIRRFTQRVGEKYAITREFCIEALEDAFLKAQENDDPSAMTKAVMGMAQIAGLLVEKHEIDGKITWADVVSAHLRKKADEKQTEDILK